MLFETIIITFCIFLNGILACSEAAFIATDKYLLKGLSKSGSEKEKLLYDLRKNPERVLSVIQIGITFVGVFAAALGGAGAQDTLAPWLAHTFSLSSKVAELLSTIAIVIPLTFFSVVLGELVPKSIALKNPFYIFKKLSYLIVTVSYIFLPIVWIFEKSTKVIVDFFKKITNGKQKGQQGVISEQGQEYIVNMVRIENATVNKALIKWEFVDYALYGDTMEDVEKKFILYGHTRLPIVKENGVVGMLNSKEFFAFQKTGNKNWISLLRKPIFFDKTTPMLKALKSLQKQSAHMAIIVEESTPLGIITIEDIFEEIVGDIYDEDDFGSIRKILRDTNSWK